MLTAQENYVPHGIATLFLIFFRGCEAGCVYESYYTHIKLYLSPHFFNYIFEWGVCVCMCVVSAHTKMRQKNEGFMALSVKLFVTLLHASNSYDKWNENERKAKVCRRKISRITENTGKYRELSLWQNLFLNGLNINTCLPMLLGDERIFTVIFFWDLDFFSLRSL